MPDGEREGMDAKWREGGWLLVMVTAIITICTETFSIQQDRDDDDTIIISNIIIVVMCNFFAR